MSYRKGQLRVEFVFSIVIFAAFLLIILNFTNTSFSDVINSVKPDIVKIKAETTLIFLTEDKNGFALQPFILNKTKIIKYSENCTNVTNLIKINTYKLIISNTTSILLECGAYGTPIVSLKRNISLIYDNNIEKGNLILEIW
ncbi:MAG: hypothetical protein QXF15_02305 [Candidatus Aenigmatarchaeota archaeon]